MSRQTIDYASPFGSGRIKVTLRSKRLRRVVFYVLAFAICYVGSYFTLSLYGTYEPAMIGLNGVKWYDWAPAGFVKDYRWRLSLSCVYMPLYVIDRKFWHRDGDAYNGKYPVHIPRHIDEVYAAWRS